MSAESEDSNSKEKTVIEDSRESTHNDSSTNPSDESNRRIIEGSSEGDTESLPSDETNAMIDRDKRTVTVDFVFDDVHRQAIDELQQLDIEVDEVLAQQLYQQAEEVVYRLRQEVKYDEGGER